MPRRPTVIVVLAGLYILSPILILAQNLILNRLPLLGTSGILSRLSPYDIVILFLYAVAGLVIYSMKRWGWYFFLVLSFILISYNVFVFAIRPVYTPLVMIAYNIALTVIASLFFRKHVIAPYFNPRIRWWENDLRFAIDIRARISEDGKTDEGMIWDISESGCLIVLHQEIPLGKGYNIDLRCLDKSVSLRGRSMRKDSTTVAGKDAFGFMFVEKDGQQKRDLSKLIGTLERGGCRNKNRVRSPSAAKTGASTWKKTARRFRLNPFASLQTGSESTAAEILDISRRGMLFAVEEELDIQLAGTMRFSVFGRDFKLTGRLHRKADSDGRRAFAIVFDDSIERRHLSRLVKAIKRMGGIPRKSRPLPEDTIDDLVAKTPYTVVLLLRKLTSPAVNIWRRLRKTS